jgi:uncharacterized damage-inducible protein DinB
MITPEYVRVMAAYNAWQNGSIYAAADQLADAERRADRGAFFKSIHATLNHLLWADTIWLSRLSDSPPPRITTIAESVTYFDVWEDLAAERRRFDGVISRWAEGVGQSDVEGDLTWLSSSARRPLKRPRALLITHVFNHQAHHRGQVHAMLTAAGATPGDTDLPFMADGSSEAAR